jgi:hypothetical protein
MKTTPQQMEQLRLLTEGLGRGQTERDVCVVCGGGDSKEKSFSVSRDEKGNIFWVCFRASCGFQGRLMVGPRVGLPEFVQRRPHATRLRFFNKDLTELSNEQKEFFKQEFDLVDRTGVKYCPEMDRYAISVLGPLGEMRGWVLRAFDNREPKTLSFPHRDEPFMSWTWKLGSESQDVVVVEDQMSAFKVREAGFRALALLGTHINYDRAYEIASQGRVIHLALDKGTMPRMLVYRDKYGPVWDTVKIWQLDKDLKYVSRKRIKEAVLEGKYDFISSI